MMCKNDQKLVLLTFVAECSIVRCAGAVTGVAMVFLDAFASILAVCPVTGAVA